ncbi:hypothetical protein HNO88_004345 [Novosphingobium chloroacetimidivorans]|uniref:Uncharacterized protein n=1 Tax=Novosphingobium chloroacetimidivorans TaxID=1428314 RepID=A0A7W7KDS9_9SPHN|nr:hypothetical protein [Novosphingobium chloroacetimidivorans]
MLLTDKGYDSNAMGNAAFRQKALANIASGSNGTERFAFSD